MRELHLVGAVILGLTFVLVSPAGSAAQSGETRLERYGDVPYLTGGVSIDGREALRERAGQEDFNLKVVVATADGTYLSDVAVRVSDAEGNLRLEVTTDGPWLYTRLPAGEYRIGGSRNGGTEEATVTLTAGDLREVVLRIP